MYPNLELEMFKRNITSRQLAQACGISECAMRNKRKGRAEFDASRSRSAAEYFYRL